MSVAPLVLAQLSQQIYDAPAAAWDGYWDDGCVVAALRKLPEADVLVLRGSVTTEDWLLDGAAVPVWHAGLGFLHAGFLAGMDGLFTQVRAAVSPGQRPVAITGHSLGGARARILAGMFAVAGLPVATLATFGAPKPGFVNLARVIQKSGMDHRSYRNRNDVVPELVPAPLWQHTEPWTTVDAAPARDDLAPLRDHSMALYVRALAPATTTAPLALA